MWYVIAIILCIGAWVLWYALSTREDKDDDY